MLLAPIPKSVGRTGYFLLTDSPGRIYLRILCGRAATPEMFFTQTTNSILAERLPRGFWQTRQGKMLVEVLSRVLILPRPTTTSGTPYQIVWFDKNNKFDPRSMSFSPINFVKHPAPEIELSENEVRIGNVRVVRSRT